MEDSSHFILVVQMHVLDSLRKWTTELLFTAAIQNLMCFLNGCFFFKNFHSLVQLFGRISNVIIHVLHHIILMSEFFQNKIIKK